MYQTTLKSQIPCKGIGLHSGEKVLMTMKPADAGTGIVFERTDLSNGARHFPARFDFVSDTFLCTTLRNASGATLSMVEHVMAALAGCGIDNALIEVNGPELPIMDGSSEAFVLLIEYAGVKLLGTPRRVVRVLREVSVTDGGKTARLIPSESRSYRCEIVYDNPRIDRQSASLDLDRETFKSGVARARTFGLMEEVEGLRAKGLALGGSLDNAVVVDGDKVLNEGGLRYDNEFARHKVLDAIGDLALADAPILGAFEGYCSGHALNNRLLKALFEDDDAWCWETAGPESERLAAIA
ncbi:MAG: UDP-3-O-acyl-N-acetylglucosamine deacetylase [Rhodospirillales bacterium]|nr:UDP-3-O-acyl-N-acetylglucosamine deacetylase [Rhodospirillales bacterium]